MSNATPAPLPTHTDFEAAAQEYMRAKLEVASRRQVVIDANALLDAAAKRCSAAETKFTQVSKGYAANLACLTPAENEKLNAG